MYCPRCGRPVNTEANFCGGCGLSKVEIEKYLQKTQPQQEVQQPQPEMPKTEPVFTQPEAPKAEPVFTEPEAVKEETVFEQVKETVQEEPSFAETEAAKEAQQKAEYTAPNYNQYSYTSANSYSQQNTATNANTYTPPVEEIKPEIKKEVPLSTVDFIWMLVISGLPVIGLIYIIYLAVQDNNINKRSYARATLIIALFSCIIALVFAVGVIAAGLI